MVVVIDLNADVGESSRAQRYGDDEGVIPFITSANIACGLHAGDPDVMRDTVVLAHAHGVSVGAHPSFDDRDGFGRREVHLPPHEVERLVAHQVEALATVAARVGVHLAHVKPHGALYNMAARDRILADAVVRGVRAIDAGLVVFGLSGSALIAAARAAGSPSASEAFADRGYLSTGALAPRGTVGAVITDVDEVVRRALGMVREQAVTTLDGGRLPLEVETLCVHGDTPGAAQLARGLREALDAAGVSVAPRVSG